ncbi:MAG: hypothetical protein AVDCRST_MAG04-3777, partial [uncultured Acetobacteraceae bacterium]
HSPGSCCGVAHSARRIHRPGRPGEHILL